MYGWMLLGNLAHGFVQQVWVEIGDGDLGAAGLGKGESSCIADTCCNSELVLVAGTS